MKCCPICDQQITKSWCKNCKKFVKPYNMKDDLYINRSHSKSSDVNCNYHNNSDEERQQKYTQYCEQSQQNRLQSRDDINRQKNTAGTRTYVTRKGNTTQYTTTNNGMNTTPSGSSPFDAKRQKKVRTVIVLVILLCMVLPFLGTIIGIVNEITKDLNRKDPVTKAFEITFTPTKATEPGNTKKKEVTVTPTMEPTKEPTKTPVEILEEYSFQDIAEMLKKDALNPEARKMMFVASHVKEAALITEYEPIYVDVAEDDSYVYFYYDSSDAVKIDMACSYPHLPITYEDFKSLARWDFSDLQEVDDEDCNIIYCVEENAYTFFKKRVALSSGETDFILSLDTKDMKVHSFTVSLNEDLEKAVSLAVYAVQYTNWSTTLDYSTLLSSANDKMKELKESEESFAQEYLYTDDFCSVLLVGNETGGYGLYVMANWQE